MNVAHSLRSGMEFVAGLFAATSAASFNAFAAGVCALAMGAYYFAKFYFVMKARRNDSAAPFIRAPRKKEHDGHDPVERY